MIRALYITSLIIVVSFSSKAQNRISYSQYMHNQGVFNPAYFSLEQKITATAYYRKQWVGVDGAPATKSFVGGIDLNDQHNININLYQDDITIYKDTKLGLGYNYRVNISKSALLSFGIKGDYGIFSGNYSTLRAQDLNDIQLTNDVSTKSYLNFGAGLYFVSNNVFAGISSPYLFNNNVVQNQNGVLDVALTFNHIYYSMGSKFEFENFSFTPTTLVKVVSGSPIQVDVNANFLIREKIWLSGGFRSDKTFILSTGVVIISNLKLIYSYDFTNFSTVDYSSGSHEVSLGYGLDFYKKNSFQKRRYFRKNMKRKRARF